MNGRPQNVATVLPDVGRLVLAPDVEPALSQARELFSPLLSRHITGDWSAAGKNQATAHDRTVHPGNQVASGHKLKTGRTIWFITYPVYKVTLVFVDTSPVPWSKDEGGDDPL